MREMIMKLTCDRCGDVILGDKFGSVVLGDMHRDNTEAWQGEALQADLCRACKEYIRSMIWIRDVDKEFGKAKALTEKVFGDGDTSEAPAEEKPAKKQYKKKIDYGKVMALYKAKWPVPKIADEMGCGVSTIYRYLKEVEENESN